VPLDTVNVPHNTSPLNVQGVVIAPLYGIEVPFPTAGCAMRTTG
jgi:hypothetical protein